MYFRAKVDNISGLEEVQVNDFVIEKGKDWVVENGYLIVNYIIEKGIPYLGQYSFIDLCFTDLASNHATQVYSFQLFD